MDNKAIINGQNIELSNDEVEGAADFHKKRIAFGEVGGVLRFNLDKSDDRDHQHWLCEDYGLTIEDFEGIIRGYMVDGEVYFYKGSDFRCVGEHNIGLDMLNMILNLYKENLTKKEVVIYNGVHIGKVGERWLPKKRLLVVKLD